jgi:hypothetical protein
LIGMRSVLRCINTHPGVRVNSRTWVRDDVVENTREMMGLNVDSAAKDVVVLGDPMPCVARVNKTH